MTPASRDWSIYGAPIFVLDEYRAIHLLAEPIDGYRILFGVWNPDNLPDF